MASVYVTCASTTADHQYARKDFERLTRYAALDSIKRHSLCDDPENADFIAFVGSFRVNYSDIRSSELFQKYREKCVVFNSSDREIPILPGVYTSLEKRQYRRKRESVRSGFYLRVTDNSSMDIETPISQADLLFSFVGNAQNHRVREELCAMNESRSLIRDSSTDSVKQSDGVSGANKERGSSYRDVIARSKFILCPRGVGVSSWRLFESMRAGRVPVVISDNWIPPEGPDWKKFSLRVSEHDIATIPGLLSKMEGEAEEMATLARQEWTRWYSEDKVFNTLISELETAYIASTKESKWSRLPIYLQYLEWHYFRHWIISPCARNLLSRNG